ncbi:MAG TPA: biotin/lipoyl-containing protein, partial [Gaiellaceae bacterium]
ALLEHECFIRGETCAGIVESLALTDGRGPRIDVARQGRTVEDVRTVEVDGRRFQVRIAEPEAPWLELARRRRERVRSGAGGGSDAVVSPMQGTVLSVAVADGDEVEAGALICIVEAMKMENEVHAHRGGTVADLSVAAGQPVATGQAICVISG